jgi:hypothetical protein
MVHAILLKFDDIKVNKVFYFKMLNLWYNMLKIVKCKHIELI